MRVPELGQVREQAQKCLGLELGMAEMKVLGKAQESELGRVLVKE